MYAFANNPRAPDNRTTVVDNPRMSAVADNLRAPDNHSRDQPPHLSHIRHHIRGYQSLTQSLTKVLNPNIPAMRDHHCLAVAKGLRPCQAPAMKDDQCLAVAKEKNPHVITTRLASAKRAQGSWVSKVHMSKVHMSKVHGPNANQNLAVPLRVSTFADNPRAPDNLSKTSQ